ncbi:MAG: glutamate-1-semialdehyde 2,1-aminomutase [Agathobaculum sp.]|jgi:glutamate-1-semialdehyde 2,1-aminomutase|uniref:glutamate-1-semialdehyde 2,1-aminomutase n=1 Tax=Agathobaculum sp. TaxID=2048138 RepID=UPI003D8DDCC0
MTQSEQLFERAQKVLPGGVNSPVRAFRAVGGKPRFLVKGLGSHVLDADGLEYIDYVGSWGPMVLGHSHPDILKAVYDRMINGLSFGAPTALEVEMAEKMVAMVPHIEMVRMVNSGTEAVMSAVRLARGATGRDKIIKFEGCYHGHSDAMLVGAGSGALTQGEPDSAGVTRGAAQDTLMAQYNDVSSVERLLDANPGAVAAVIVEPVAANMGVVPPKDGFLQSLRHLCDRHGALLIFDEVITGFRLAAGGAQQYFGVRADLVTFGKIIGGGMPVGAYAGSRALMEQVAPCGPVYQAGTLSGNPVAMAAGLAQLQILTDHPEVYTVMETSAQYLANHLRTSAARHGLPVQVNQVGSLLCPYFTETPVDCFAAAKTSDTAAYAAYFNGMLSRGVYLAPSQFEAMFVSSAHTQNDLAFTAQAADEVLADLAQRKG